MYCWINCSYSGFCTARLYSFTAYPDKIFKMSMLSSMNHQHKGNTMWLRHKTALKTPVNIKQKVNKHYLRSPPLHIPKENQVRVINSVLLLLNWNFLLPPLYLIHKTDPFLSRQIVFSKTFYSRNIQLHVIF